MTTHEKIVEVLREEESDLLHLSSYTAPSMKLRCYNKIATKIEQSLNPPTMSKVTEYQGKPMIDEMRKINGVVMIWNGTKWEKC